MLLQKVFLRLRVNILYPRHVRVERPGNGRGKILSVIAMISLRSISSRGVFWPPPLFLDFSPRLSSCLETVGVVLSWILHTTPLQILELMSKCQGEENTPSFIN